MLGKLWGNGADGRGLWGRCMERKVVVQLCVWARYIAVQWDVLCGKVGLLSTDVGGSIKMVQIHEKVLT